MAAAAVDRDVQDVRTGLQGPGPGGDDAVFAHVDVGAEGRDGPRAGGVEDAFGDHHRRPVVPLLARLEHEPDISAQLAAMGVEQACGTDESGSVQVVSAGVHVLVGRGERLCGQLLDGQGVHVPTQQHRGSLGRSVRRGAPQHGHHLGGSLPGGDLEVEVGQGLQHRGLGAWEIESDLGVGVESASQLLQLRQESGGLGQEVLTGAGHAAHRRLTSTLAMTTEPAETEVKPPTSIGGSMTLSRASFSSSSRAIDRATSLVRR